ncbi:MAG: PD40 domain-containing protein [Marinilabiliaceae bacterium]|nr:PD40 domain-containing protein [Marinilabiliaceae bacterium]
MKTLFLIVLCWIGISASAQKQQPTNRTFQQAVSKAEHGDFKTAIQLMKRVLKSTPKQPEALFALGDFYLNTTDGRDSALTYLEKAYFHLHENDRNSIFGVDLQMALANTYHLLNQPQKGIDTYQRLIAVLPERATPQIAEANREIEMCQNLIEARKNPVKMEVINLGNTVNSKHDDHSPLITTDGQSLFFTSRRPSSYSSMMPDGQFAEKIYFSTRDSATGRWSNPIITNRLFKTQGHEACVAISSDGQELFLFRNDQRGKKIYSSRREGKTWSEPLPLPKPINSDANETHLTLSPDQSTLYFTSDRSGGIGGLDIYRVRKMPDGTWSKAQNLGPEINTPYDEETPVLHSDGKRLYFASNGHNSMGGFDIFVSQLNNDSTWTQPVNMGYPINTADDDFFFYPSMIRNQAYYATAKFTQGSGGMDLYRIEYDDPIENRLAVYSGIINANENMPLENVKIIISDKKTGAVEGQYKPHPGTGKYVLILEAGKSYDMVFGGEGITPMEMQLDIPSDNSFSLANQVLSITQLTLNASEINRDTKTIETNKGQYTVQVLALYKPCKSWDKAFKGLSIQLIKENKCDDGIYRYIYGGYTSYREAMKVRDQLQAMPAFFDAFVRSQNELERLMQNQQNDRNK